MSPRIRRGDSMGAISETQVAMLAAAVPGFAGQWSLQRHRTVAGALMVVLMPQTEAAATFVIDAAVEGINLSLLRDDVLHPCGYFATMAELIPILRGLVHAEQNPADGSCSSLGDVSGAA